MAMPELVHLRFGALPWRPADNAMLIEVFDRHDRPTCGLIEQQGHTFLFDCIEGQAWDINVWAYVQVSEDQIAKLRPAEGAEFAQMVDQAMKDSVVVAALAVGDRLELAEVIETADVGSNLYAAIMEAILAKIEKGTSAAKTLRKVQLVS
ncbi:hypothetical protein ACTWPT_10795 [Nonomuraea sp. 3N208]|uniref:hypothetical protein n=1 Tax=Nonomuraea sp. 3N208 TaxID=3457421 RepID=UPI003FCCA0AA